MIWHILRKDWKLLWWQALAVVALATAATLFDIRNGYFGAVDAATTRAEIAFGVLAVLAGLMLVTQLIQQDPVPGGGQDWLVRPIKRTDLLLAKILFIVLALELPMLVITVATELVQGFSLTTSLSFATRDMVFTTLSLGLPALAFASLFRGLTETIAATFAVVLGLMAGGFFLTGKANFPLTGPASGTGVHWLPDVAQSSLYLLGALAVLALQYFRRQTVRSRWIAAAFFVLARLTPLVPWQAAFAVQQHLAPATGAAASVALAFDSSSSIESNRAFCIPLTVSGLPTDSWLNVDSVSASLIDGQARVVWTTRIPESSVSSSSPLSVIRGNFRDAANTGRCQLVPISVTDIDHFANTPSLRARLDYSLTLFGPDKAYTMPVASSSGSEQILPDFGRCMTQLGNEVKLGCLTQKAPTCATAFLQDKTTGTSSASATSCIPDYDPFRGGDVGPWGSDLSIPWRNLPDHAINNWQLVLHTYKPLGHFTRQLTTPEINLRDLRPRS